MNITINSAGSQVNSVFMHKFKAEDTPAVKEREKFNCVVGVDGRMMEKFRKSKSLTVESHS